MAEEKPKSIFYSLSQALKGEKKDIPAELNRTNNLVNPSATNQSADFIQQSQQRFLDFQSLKISQDLYTRSVYYDSDRITAYNDYRAMDQSPEISVALDIMSDEALSRGDDGEILKIYSEDSRIKRVLKDLFHKTLNVNYNLWFWTRTLLKYGDNFLKLELDQNLGIYNITQLPTGEIHKEMGWDGNPYSTRFKWDIQNMYFEDFQIAHFSLISDGEKIPYGRSVLDSVRKIWKQLQLAEDAMLVYRMCLQGETRIRTSNGYKYIKDINVGDEVISYNQSGNLEKSKVIHHINNGKKKLLRIRSIHNELLCTETHPILIYDNGVVKYVDAADLKIKKHKLINTNTSNLNIKEKEIELFFTEKYGKLSKKAIDLLRGRKDLNKSSIINSCLKTDKFDSGRIKQFIYSDKKGLPIDIATDVCEKFDIDVKNLIVYNKSFFNEDRLNLPKFVNPEFSRLLGFLFGDGWISKNKFGFAEGVDESVNSKYKKLLEKYFSKVVYEPDNREGRNYGKYAVNSTLAVNVLKSLGFNGSAHTKRIPSWLFSCNTEIRKEFILGLSDADGCERLTNKGTWFSTIELCNKKLIEDVKELWSSIGLCSGHIKSRKRIGGHVIDKESGRVVKDTISHSVTISQLELPKYENIISVEEFGEEDVYDISVDNKLHNFIANNVPVHNTRAPERRMFFLDVGNTDAPDVQQYVEKIMSRIKKSQVVDPKTGNINMKFNMMTFEEDFVIPVRGDKTGTRVETLPGACLALDTEIYLLDGRCLKLQDIIKEFESGAKLETYSINPESGQIVPGQITWAGITRKNTDVIKILLDNGESIICTPDHKFPTRFNGKKEAKDLICGESLWSFNKKFDVIRKNKKSNKYEMIYDHSKNKWVFTHRMVANFYKLNNLINELVFNEQNKDELKNTIHHINFNRFNNSFDNLAFMSNSDHYQYHQHLILEYSKVASDIWLKKYNTDSNFKKSVIDRLNKNREDYYNKRSAGKKMEHNEAISSGLKKYFESLSKEDLLLEMKPLFNNQKKARINLNKKLQNKDFKNEIYKKVSQKSKITKNLPENKLKYRANTKKLWENNDFRNSIVEKQTFKYSNLMLDFVVKKFNNGLSAKDIINEINKPNSEFIIEFKKINKKNLQLKKMKNGFTHNNLYKMMKNFGYNNWKDFKNKVEFFNHKIISIEWLNEKQDTGTITIDGDEIFHNFHNFALKSGVFTQNSNLGDIMDIEYLQNKLFTGIKVPKAYLNYAEGLPGSSTLSQADLRFSRTINRFQEAIILELRNIANIHLKLLGFDDDLNNFTLTLTNPSTQQELLKLETMKARNDVFKEMFSSDATSPVSYTWAMEYILGFSKSEIKQMVRQKKIERKMFYEIERAHEEYQDTGIFTELDKKFRKPDFDPNTQIDTENGPGGDDAGGGGGGGSFGGGSSFGMDDLGGGMDMGEEPTPEAGPEGTEMAGAEDTGTEEEQPPLQENVLLKKNQVFDLKTKNILSGIDSFLKKINQINENKQ